MDHIKTTYRGKEFFVYDTAPSNHFISSVIRNGDLWEELPYERLKNIGNPTNILIDIGGEIGSYCIPLSDFYDKVITFEPNKNNFNLILKSIDANNIENIIPINKGCGKSSEKGNLVTEYNNVIDLAEEGDVEIVSLDTELKELDIDFNKVAAIKLDVEGFEYQVLLGAREAIETSKPIIYLETHPMGTVVEDCYFFLENLGYSPLIKYTDHDWVWGA